MNKQTSEKTENIIRIPKHVAIIMDGNGRWAKQRGNQRIFGHKNGVRAVRETVETAGKLGVEFLTLYAFSSENWKRPKSEVNGLMSLFIQAVKNETENLMQNNVRMAAIGNLRQLPSKVQKNLYEIIEKTAQNTGLTLILALSYGASEEITEAVKSIARKVKENQLTINEITPKILSQHLQTSAFPNPDLLIRTGGELRISNFLLWQIAYTEFYFTETLWPDFSKEIFLKAIENYGQRERRFGKTSEQIQNTN
ncbi:MAG: di-trans,poly-cis-decaprenylcistransferase [Bacteroidia bacterium]|nr:MAG: di-trans,poly-cis-decaprenylcistransferase [Bacteroidia bacterium]